jgi:hypothetical protein
MTTIVSGNIVTTDAGTVNPILAYDNVLARTGATVLASSEATGYDKEYLYDWRPYTWWQPTAAGNSWVRVSLPNASTVDYFGVAGHNLGSTGSTIKLQYSTDAGATWNDATGALAGGENKVLFDTFAPITASEWRIYVYSPSSAPSIGVVAFGERINFPRGLPPSGFRPPTLARNNAYETSVSDGGLFLGRSLLRQTYRAALNITLLDADWVRAYWETFMDHAELKPFFFAWNNGIAASEAVFAWMRGTYASPVYDTTRRMTIALNMDCLK